MRTEGAGSPPAATEALPAPAPVASPAGEAAPAPASADPGLYIHIPFCRRRCHYCDFNVDPVGSVQTADAGTAETDRLRRRAARYLDLLERELALRSGEGDERPRVQTVHIGGGTPSLLSPGEIARLFSAIGRHFTTAAGAEVGLEANPGTLDGEKLDALRRAGVNRLSLGLQAWQDHHLRRLGRLHDRGDFVRTFRAARQAGFDNLSVDVMCGLPGQTMEEWSETLTQVLRLEPDHVSTYGLQIEQDTAFGRWHAQGILDTPAEEAEREMYDHARETLRAAGFRHYEISNFARPGRASRHNRLYWLSADYIGAGTGAHSHRGGRRFWNVRGQKDYADALREGELPAAGGEDRSPREQMADAMMLGLRLVAAGVSPARFGQRFGADPRDLFEEELEGLTAQGLVEMSAERVRLTEAGVPVANRVFMAFV